MRLSLSFMASYQAGICLAVCPAGEDVIEPYLEAREGGRRRLVSESLAGLGGRDPATSLPQLRARRQHAEEAVSTQAGRDHRQRHRGGPTLAPREHARTASARHAVVSPQDSDANAAGRRRSTPARARCSARAPAPAGSAVRRVGGLLADGRTSGRSAAVKFSSTNGRRILAAGRTADPDAHPLKVVGAQGRLPPNAARCGRPRRRRTSAGCGRSRCRVRRGSTTTSAGATE